jgi:glycosyltransferase involved in cell wall biosynthesis
MKRIAFVHNWFPAGGAERVTIDIAEYLNMVGGYEVYVFATHLSESMLTEKVQKVVHLRSIPSQAIPSRRSAAIEKLLVDEHIDILVQVVKSLPDIEGIKARTGCKVVLACHGEPFWQRHAIMHRRRKGFFRKLLWYLYNKRRFEDGTLAMKLAVERSRHDYVSCDAYTVLCEPYRTETAEVLGLDPVDNHIYVIENPENPVDDVCLEKENVMLFCGRFENWSKRIDRLLRIWSKVQGALPDWRLVLVGDGRDGKMLRELAGELGLERVSFEGMQTDVRPYYAEASVLCLTSETEGWPLTLTEGQANGCICVAFGCTSGVKEILSPDGECGFIVPPYDEDMYAQVLLKIASMDKESQITMRRRAVERRLEYTPEKIAVKWKSLFDMLCNQKQ